MKGVRLTRMWPYCVVYEGRRLFGWGQDNDLPAVVGANDLDTLIRHIALALRGQLLLQVVIF